MVDCLSADEFVDGFIDIPERLESHFVDIGGAEPVATRAWPAPGAKALVVLFHGAVNRKTHEYPKYLGYRRGVHPHAHQIAFSDPSLLLSDKLSMGWFAGSSGTPLQSLLPPFITGLVESLGVEKLIFVGGSGGGFAALFYSWAFPGSTAVVMVPQTNINGYHRSHREAYIESSWPNLEGAATDTATPRLDLRTLYSKGMENTVIYLQSSLDLFHVEKQMAPFVRSLPAASFSRFMLKCSFWGKVGHSGSVPSSEVDAWVRATLSVEDNTAENIANAYHLGGFNQATEPADPKHSGKSSSTPEEPNSTDKRLTAEIAAHMLA